MDFVDFFGHWLFCLTMVAFLGPIEACIAWIKRGSSDGYPSIGTVFALASFSLWLYYGHLKQDRTMMMINGMGLVTHIGYTLIYDFYLNDKKHLHYQLAAVAVALTSIFMYMWDLPPQETFTTTGRVCTIVQLIGCLVGFYGIYYVITIKTTEYMPFRVTLLGAFVNINSLIYALLVNDFYMIVSNCFNLTLALTNIAMYFVYPPQTWQLPWQKKETEKPKIS